jgi:hypothetical protein
VRPSVLVTAFESFTGLEDLSLTLESDEYSYYSREVYTTEYEYMANDLFSALEQVPKLRRFGLEGDFRFSGASLIAFVERHASTLCNLTLYGSILRGHWIPTLRAISEVTCGTVEYLRVLSAWHATVGRTPDRVDFNKIRSQLPRFECVTNFGLQTTDQDG